MKKKTKKNLQRKKTAQKGLQFFNESESEEENERCEKEKKKKPTDKSMKDKQHVGEKNANKSSSTKKS